MLAQHTPSFDLRLSDQLQRALALCGRHLSDAAPRVRAFLAQFADPPPYGGFKAIPPGARALYAAVLAEGGQDAGAPFLLACLLAAVRASLDGPLLARLPARVRAHQVRQFARMASHDEAFLPYCRLDGDVFLKEFGLATLRLYAGASSVIDPRSGIGRSLLFKGGLPGLPGRALLLARAGGFKPYFEIHVHKLYQDEFNEEGRNECYRCCADLYELHPEVLGMVAGSWFYDPVVTIISPHLAYLRTVPEGGGARALFVSHDEQAAKNATATSEKRRALHAAGQYRPASWTLVWAKRDQLAWSRRPDVLDRK
ncbi:hypothetical protein ACFPOU_07320 [Massilia jejuensis]|uniref:Uncharacterized protein n=1 Tax=Massilia jejuensis TaxID=648894 RepID=A0ABW0PE67_9BURK